MQQEQGNWPVGTAYDRPYEVLGVPRDAPADDLRGAYLWLARRHTPEDAPREHALICAAYRVLADPGSRRRLDARERFPEQAQAALDVAANCIVAAPRRAAHLAGEIVADTTQPQGVRVAAASICVAAAAPDTAVSYLTDVVATSPNDVEAVCRLAEAHIVGRRFETAADLLQRAVVRHPREPELRVCLARLHGTSGDLESAESMLRSAVKIQGVSESRSVPLQFMRLALLAESGLFARMQLVAREIRTAIQAGDDVLERHVVSRYANWGAAAVAARSYEVAGFLFECACELAPTDDLKRQRDEVAPLAVSQQEAHAALLRTEVAGWIKSLLRAMLGGAIAEDRRHALITAARRTYASEPQAADAEWSRFESDHPAAARFIATYRDQIRADVISSRAGVAPVAVAPVTVAPVTVAPVAVARAPAPAVRPATAVSSASTSAASSRRTPRGSRHSGARKGRRPGDRPSIRNKTTGASVGGIVLSVIIMIVVKSCVREALRPKPTPQQQLHDFIPRVDRPMDAETLRQIEKLGQMTPEEREAYLDEVFERADDR